MFMSPKVRSLLRRQVILPFSFLSGAMLLCVYIFNLHVPHVPDTYLLWGALFFGYVVFFLWLITLPPQHLASIVAYEIARASFVCGLFFLALLQFLPGLLPYATVYIVTLMGAALFLYRAYIHRPVPRPPTLSVHALLTIVGALFLFYIVLTVGIALHYHGSYIDEYLNVISGLHFFSTGRFAQFTPGVAYYRGALISLLVGLEQIVFGPSLTGAKSIPAIIGLINFVLLFLIARRTLRRETIPLLLVGYALSPLVLVNHFYIRFFVLYECVLLVLTYLFLRIQRTIPFRRLLLIGACIGAAVIGTLDLGVYFAIFPAVATVGLLFLFEPEALGLRLHYLVRIGTVLLLLLVGSIVFDLPLRVWMVFFDTLASPPKFGFNYVWYFLEVGLPVTLFFFFGIALLVREKRERSERIALYYFVSVLVLFLLHLISSKNIQVIRAVLYFLPLYYLVAYKGLEYFKPSALYPIFALLMFISIFSGYSPSLIASPHIPYEVNYIDDTAFAQAKSLCSQRLVITSGRPEILQYWGIHVDAFYFPRYHSPDPANDIPDFDRMLVADGGSLRYSLTGTPVLTTLPELEDFTAKKSYCFLDGFGLPNAWVDSEARQYLDEYATRKVDTFLSTSPSFRTIIYTFDAQG